MIKIEKYDFYIFDCDGVILNSNQLKTKAFSKSLHGEDAILISDFIKYHKQNGGISRHEKFRYFFEKIKKQPNSNLEIHKALVRFSEIVKHELIQCDYVPGFLKFIRKIFNINPNIFVVSGSEENELNYVFNKRKINQFFKKIYGSPNDKSINTLKVISNFSNISNSGVFFGDSKIDYETAKEFNLDFIFVKSFSEWKNGSETINNKNIINNFLNI